MTSGRKIKRRNDRRRAGLGIPRTWLDNDASGGRIYVLRGRRPVRATWGQAMVWLRQVHPDGDLRSTLTLAYTKGNGFIVSTIFLVVSQGINPDRPVLFESMHRKRGGGWEGGQRYYTYEQAMKGHREYMRGLARAASSKK